MPWLQTVGQSKTKRNIKSNSWVKQVKSQRAGYEARQHKQEPKLELKSNKDYVLKTNDARRSERLLHRNAQVLKTDRSLLHGWSNPKKKVNAVFIFITVYAARASGSVPHSIMDTIIICRLRAIRIPQVLLMNLVLVSAGSYLRLF